MFADMTLEGMHSQFRPKVQGSILVEEIYGGMDLDFFILFGSATGISGNWGQSAYAAATNFMTNMIRARRKKRLVGSILYPSEIRGIGYFMRRDSGLSQLMNNTIGRAFLSERGLHEMFAEAILAGRPDSGRCPEIMITPRLASPLELPNILWYRNPKLWEFIDYSMQSTSSQTAGQAVSIKEQLQSATSMCEAVNVIAEGFGAKLTHKLHLSAEIPVTPATRLSELGVDSLVAVDLRTWFVKELEVDIPMLRILGGSSIGELAEEAASKLSPDMLPRIERGQDQQQAADIKQGQEPQSPRDSATVSTGTESDWYRDFTPQTRSDDEESGSAS
jgi:acyl carrier protein